MRDIVERLKEKIIVDAFVSGSISDGALCDRLIRERLDAADEIERLRAENETLRRDVKTAVMGDSAELQDVKRENKKLRDEVMSAFFKGYDQGARAERERCAKIAERYLSNHEPVRLTVSSIAAAIRESGE